MFKLEQELHDYFAEKRKRGEWFELDEVDLGYLEEVRDSQWKVDFFSVKPERWK